MPEPIIPTTVLGTTGLMQQNGVIFEEFLKELRGAEGRRVIKEMRDNDPVIGAFLFALEMLMRQVRWSLKPADKDNESLKVAELVHTAMLNDMYQTWENVLSEILSFLPYGWSWMEIVYKVRAGYNRDPYLNSLYNDGFIGWADWSVRGQDSLSKWGFDQFNRVTGMYQNAYPKYNEVFIPREKSLHFTTTNHKHNPEGKSIFRNAYRAWYFKKHIEVIEAIGVERDLAGLPMIEAPPELFFPDPPAELAAVFNHLKTIVRNVRRDEQEGILMPSQYDENGHPRYRFTLVGSPGARQFETSQIIERWDTRILMSVLADFIMLGHDSIGSFALSSDKTNLFAVAVGSWLDLIKDETQNRAIRELVRLNGFPVERTPQLVHSDLETVSMKDFADYLTKIVSVGVDVSDVATQKQIRRVGGLPQLESEDL